MRDKREEGRRRRRGRGEQTPEGYDSETKCSLDYWAVLPVSDPVTDCFDRTGPHRSTCLYRTTSDPLLSHTVFWLESP